MKVQFWFDPACPFCWMTSRWVNSIAPQRDLDIEWKSISLLFKNDPPVESPFYPKVTRTRDLLRVVEALRAAGHGDRIGDVYREFGRRIHNEQQPEFDVAAVLTELGLDPAHADALTDDSYDAAIRASMDDGLALTGPDVGTPLIAIEIEGRRVGYFGPVITEFPEGDAALRLWDGFVNLLSVPGFFELKRTRTSAPALPPVDRL